MSGRGNTARATLTGGRQLLIFFCTRVWAVWVEERAGSPFGTADAQYALIATEGDAACTCKIASLPSASFQNVSVPWMRWFNSNSHREDAKNAKKAVGELVDFLFPSRSRRLGGERLNPLDLLLASGLVLVRAALPPVSVVPELLRPLHSMASTPIFTAKTPRTPRKRWVNLLISSSLRALGVLAVSD